jgi:hypothetical protein
MCKKVGRTANHTLLAWCLATTRGAVSALLGIYTYIHIIYIYIHIYDPTLRSDRQVWLPGCSCAGHSHAPAEYLTPHRASTSSSHTPTDIPPPPAGAPSPGLALQVRLRRFLSRRSNRRGRWPESENKRKSIERRWKRLGNGLDGPGHVLRKGRYMTVVEALS